MYDIQDIEDATNDGIYDAENWHLIPRVWHDVLKAEKKIGPTDGEYWSAYDEAARHEIERAKDEHRRKSLQREYENGRVVQSAVNNAHRLIVFKWMQNQQSYMSELTRPSASADSGPVFSTIQTAPQPFDSSAMY